MSVWLTIPSARPPEEAEKCLKLWRERGYCIALWRDGAASFIEWQEHGVNLCATQQFYPGYAEAVNKLIQYIMLYRADAEWFIAAGDDTEPDPNKSAEQIAEELFEHFSLMPGKRCSIPDDQVDRNGTCPECKARGTFGVMQPTGDRWQEGMGGFENAPIDRVCGSAWYGREYCRRMYQGAGPLFSGYKHMFVDQEAQEVALKMGVLWQRRDLTQKHNHVLRGATDKELVDGSRLALKAPHLVKWNTQEHWNESKALFESRKAAGFPGHEPL